MKTESIKTGMLLAASGLLLSAIAAFAQGSLTPPGAPAPLFKTLDQIEPRIAITNLPITISQGGSYYLTKSFAQSFAFDAITIRTNNVTLDLCGFTIQQTVGTNFASGIFIGALGVNTPTKEIVVKNGFITGFASGSGIDCRGPRNCVFENLTVTGCTTGIGSQAFGTAGVVGNSIRHCRLCDNTGSGVLILSGASNIRNVIENCESINNLTGIAVPAGGNLIINCLTSGNANNYSVGIGNRAGLFVLPTTNSVSFNGSSGGSGSGTTDPFANLSY